MTKATQAVHAASQVAATNDIRDIVPPVAIPSGWTWVGWLLLGLALGATAFWLWRRWRRRRAAESVVPPLPPHIRARQRLQEALAWLGQPREFCIRVSDAVRHYLEERFDFHAPERTTEEFLVELKDSALLLPDQKESLGDFLTRCDLVKFARYEPAEPELRDLHAAALRLIEETEPVAVSTTEGQPPAADSPPGPADRPAKAPTRQPPVTQPQ